MAIVKMSALKRDKWMLGVMLLVLVVLLSMGCYYFKTCTIITTPKNDDTMEYWSLKKIGKKVVKKLSRGSTKKKNKKNKKTSSVGKKLGKSLKKMFR